MSLQKISTFKLFQLQTSEFEKYHIVLKHLNPIPDVIPMKNKIESITDLTFGEVASIKMLLAEPNYNNLVEIYKIIFGLEDLITVDVVQFYHSINWIKNELEDIYNREVENLTSTPDSKLKDAGIEDLNIFGELNTLIMLGEKFSKSPQEIENWNYNLVFSLTLHQKISNDINKRYIELNKPVQND